MILLWMDDSHFDNLADANPGEILREKFGESSHASTIQLERRFNEICWGVLGERLEMAAQSRPLR